MRQTLTVSEAARALGMTAAGLKHHDAELQPERIGAIGLRVYRRDVIERFAAARENKQR